VIRKEMEKLTFQRSRKRMKRLLVEKNKESDNRQRDKLLIHLLAIKNPHLPAVTNGYKNLKFVDVGKI